MVFQHNQDLQPIDINNNNNNNNNDGDDDSNTVNPDFAINFKSYPINNNDDNNGDDNGDGDDDNDDDDTG